MSAGIGHNQGPALEAGTSWRRHCWGKARKDLLPQLPIEVVRNRVRRAAEIGLDYRTYATVRASTGRDIVAFLFSTNALRLFRSRQKLEQARADKLASLKYCDRRGLVVAPLKPAAVLDQVTGAHGAILDAVVAAPNVHASWTQAAAVMDAARTEHTPADAVLLIGDTMIEQEWAQAGRLAGYLDAERFFPSTPC